MRIGQKLGDTCLCIFKMVAATILNFIESLILGHDNPLMANLRNLTQIPLSKTDIWSKNNIQDSCCRHFEFPTITILYPIVQPSYGQYEASHQIWCKSVKNSLRYTCSCISKMAAVCHLGLVILQLWIIHCFLVGLYMKLCYTGRIVYLHDLQPAYYLTQTILKHRKWNWRIVSQRPAVYVIWHPTCVSNVVTDVQSKMATAVAILLYTLSKVLYSIQCQYTMSMYM